MSIALLKWGYRRIDDLIFVSIGRGVVFDGTIGRIRKIAEVLAANPAEC